MNGKCVWRYFFKLKITIYGKLSVRDQDTNEDKLTGSVKREEEYNSEDLIKKNAKTKDILYKGLQRSMLYKVSSRSFARDIWDSLAAEYGNEDIELALNFDGNAR